MVWPGMKQGLLQPEAAEELDEARHADFGGEHAAADVGGAVLAAIGAEPARHGVTVHTECTEDLLRHRPSFASW